jgi:hypothetical protein
MDYLQTLITIIWVVAGTARTVSWFWKKIQKFITEETDRRIDETNKRLDDTNRRIEDVATEVLRGNILNLIHHDPHNKQAILLNYEEYKRKWGNSYIDYVYYEWKKDFLDKDTEPIKYELLNHEKQKWDG